MIVNEENKMAKISNAIEDARNELTPYMFKNERDDMTVYPILISLYGSQNYGMDTEESDIDLRAVVCPSLENIILNGGVVSKTITRWNGNVDVKDVKSFVNLLKKGNPTYIESILTPYKMSYTLGLAEAVNILEEYSDVLSKRFMCAAMGTINSKLSHMYNEDSISNENFNYNGKDFYTLVRMYDLMVQVSNGKNLSKLSYRVEDNEFRKMALMAKNYHFTDDLAKSYSSTFVSSAEKILHSFLDEYEEDESRLLEMNNAFDNMIYFAIKERIYDGYVEY